MFNTTILEPGFYLQMEGEDSGFPRIYFDELAHTYMTIHNSALERLQDATVLDRYYRLLCPPEEGLVRLKAYYSEDEIQYQTLPNSYADLLSADIIFSRFNLPYQTPQWMLCYPSKVAELPLVALEEAIVKHDADRIQKFNIHSFQREELDIILPVGDWAADGIITDFRLFNDVNRDRLHIEFDLRNQYGNKVTIVVISNTVNTDNFIQRITDEGIFADTSNHLAFHFGRCISLINAHKLLFRVTYYTDGEEVKEDDLTDT